MLEGKEVDKKLGENGSLVVDIDQNGVARVELGYGSGNLKAGAFVEVGVLDLLEAGAKKSAPLWDDAVVAQVRLLLKL